jgi:hypothetical protein
VISSAVATGKFYGKRLEIQFPKFCTLPWCGNFPEKAWNFSRKPKHGNVSNCFQRIIINFIKVSIHYLAIVANWGHYLSMLEKL